MREELGHGALLDEPCEDGEHTREPEVPVDEERVGRPW